MKEICDKTSLIYICYLKIYWNEKTKTILILFEAKYRFYDKKLFQQPISDDFFSEFFNLTEPNELLTNHLSFAGVVGWDHYVDAKTKNCS